MNAIVDQGIKYLANGHMVRVLAQAAPDQIVVELGRTYENDPEEVFFEGTRVVKKVYDRPPVDALHTDITKLETRQAGLRESVRALEETERGVKKRVEALKVYDQLARVEDFLSGKITHYVLYGNYYSNQFPIPRISTPQAEISGDDQYGEVKLLALYGTRERTLEWKLNRYSDGSGDKSHCIPCCSLEEAQQKAREILAESISKYKVPDQYNCQHGLELVQAAKTYGVPLPDGFEEALRRCQIRNRESEVVQKQKELDVATAALQAAKGIAP